MTFLAYVSILPNLNKLFALSLITFVGFKPEVPKKVHCYLFPFIISDQYFMICKINDLWKLVMYEFFTEVKENYRLRSVIVRHLWV